MLRGEILCDWLDEGSQRVVTRMNPISENISGSTGRS